MIGSYLGTVAAFVFAMASPGRIIRQVSVSDPGSVVLVIALVLATSAALVLALARTVGRPLPAPTGPRSVPTT